MVEPNLKLELSLTPGTIFQGNGGVEKWVSPIGGHCFTQDTVANKPQLGNNGAYFDGGDWMTAYIPSLLGTSFTVEFWASFSTIPASLSAAVFLSKTLNINNRIYFGFYNASGTHQLQIYSNYGAVVAVNYVVNTAFVTNTFYHLAFVAALTNYKIFVNGSLVGQTTGAGTITDNGSNVVLGQELSSAYFNGKMTDICIWDIAKYAANFTPPPRRELGMSAPIMRPPSIPSAGALGNSFQFGS